MKTSARSFAATAALAALPLMAHDAPQASMHEVHVHEAGAGSPVAPARAVRTVNVEMDDSMRYTPAQIHVKRGEAVRIVATNRGKLLHEVVIGTRAELDAHAKHMREHPGMKHDDPNTLQVPAGTTREMGWRFTRAGDFLYGCLVPGHFEAGMVGTIVVAP